MAWPEGLRVAHLAEWLADVVGPGVMAARVVKRLSGMRLAVHYGCHLLRPQPAVRWDDPMQPTKVETLVGALGARVVDYPSKMLCCGGALDRGGARDASLAFARRKLRELTEAKVDALIVTCPSCFQQFDLNQAALQRVGENVNVPVLYLSELVALAYGHAPDEIGLDLHRVSVEPFLSAWERARRRPGAAPANCSTCRCSRSATPAAPVATTARWPRWTRPSSPTSSSPRSSRASSTPCSTPVRPGSASSASRASSSARRASGWPSRCAGSRSSAPRAACQPEQLRQAFEQFAREGALGKPREGARRKLGLPASQPNGGEALRALLAADPDPGEDRS